MADVLFDHAFGNSHLGSDPGIILTMETMANKNFTASRRPFTDDNF